MAFITVKKVKGNKYYYLVESRREGRKVKQVVLEYIGNEDALAKYANSQLKEIGKKNSGDASLLDNVGFKSYKHGSVMALYWMTRKIGIEKIIDRTLPPKTIKGCARSRVLLLAMIHRAVDPGSKRAFADWSEGTTLPYYLRYDSGDMDSQSFWEAMDGISDEELVALQEAVAKRVLKMTGEKMDSFHLDPKSRKKQTQNV